MFLEKAKRSGGWMKLVNIAIALTLVFGNVSDIWALRPNDAMTSSGGNEVKGKLFQYGFAAKELEFVQGRTEEAISSVFARKAAVNLIGHQATLNMDEVVEDFIKTSQDKEITKEKLVERLILAKDFLNRVINDDEFLLKLLDEVSQEVRKISASGVVSDLRINLMEQESFLNQLKRASELKREEKLKLAKKIFIDETRWSALLLGKVAGEASLFSLGEPQSDTHKAVVAHIGTHKYAGSEGIGGGARTNYFALARLEGFAKRGDKGLDAYRHLVIHEFKDWVRKGHRDEAPGVMQAVEEVNREIDKELGIDSAKYFAALTADNDKVKISTYYNEDNIGKRDEIAFYIVSKTHPVIKRNSGQKVTVVKYKADVGSRAGHVKPTKEMMLAARDVVAAAAARGTILSAFVYSIGDDIQIIMTHGKGKDDLEVGKVAGEAFMAGTKVALAQNNYAAGQDVLNASQVTSGNIKGAGPGVVQQEFLERKGEIILDMGADKMGPGDLNAIPIRAIFDPIFSSFPTLKTGRRFRADILEFETGLISPLIVETMEDYHTLIYYGGFPGQYAIQDVYLVGEEQSDGSWVEKNEIVYSNTASRLREEAEELTGNKVYIGKDDPGAFLRAQGFAPASGIAMDTVGKPYLVQGWMMGSHWGPLFPVGLKHAVIGRYDGYPLITMIGFQVNDGVLSEPEDLLGGQTFDIVREKQAAIGDYLRNLGFFESARLPLEDIEYHEAASTFTRRFNKYAWHENLLPFATAFRKDIHYEVPSEVMAINNAKEGKAYTIVINHEDLLKDSPVGLMALKKLLEQKHGKEGKKLGEGNIKIALHVNRDIQKADAEKIIDESFGKINKINDDSVTISRSMFSAVVTGTDASSVSEQIKAKLNTEKLDVVIGNADYVQQFADATKVVLDPVTEAGTSNVISVTKALKLSLNLIPAIAKGKEMAQEDVKKLDSALSLDQDNIFHVAPVKAVETVEKAATNYKTALEKAGVSI